MIAGDTAPLHMLVAVWKRCRYCGQMVPEHDPCRRPEYPGRCAHPITGIRS